jgi:hypothetical protein
MTNLLQRLRTGEGGYAMVAVLAVMLMASLAAVAAVRAADSDLVQGADDREGKRAYAAAEAGVNDYLARLAADVDYWRKCEADPENRSLNEKWNGTGTDPRQFVPIENTNAQYAIEVLPANGATSCQEGPTAQASFIDNTSGIFRIRATGRVGDEKRSIIASFKRRGFLDFVYFTDFETFPAEFMVTHQHIEGWNTRVSSTNPQTVVEWARTACAQYYRDGRGLATNEYVGQEQNPSNGTWGPIRTSGGTAVDINCQEIQFKADATGIDKQKGPFHTNDELLICGAPWFGEKPADDIEVSAPAPQGGTAGNYGSSSGWRPNCGGSNPKVNDPTTNPPDGSVGTWRKSSALMTLPPSNAQVANEALPAYRFVGRTEITMTGDTMTVTGRRANGQMLTNASMPMPTDGVISVANNGVCGGLDILKPLSSPTTCGDLWISGTYNKNVTFTAANDILIRENVLKSTAHDVMLGLIASQFVRVHHPTSTLEGYSCGSNSGGPGSIQIDAAMLAVNKSFTVDKYWCGANLGTLTVNGTIAQQFRGTVGRGSSGYTKDYNYDRRLRFRSPPRFLDPVQSSWKLHSQVEQVPAT